MRTTCAACHSDNPEGFKFCGYCGQPLEAIPAVIPQERRLLTVMMIDLKGSTELGDHADIEDVQALVDAYHRLAAETIEAAGGHVAKYMGDGVMAFFGYPNPIERPAAQAVAAALNLAAAWSSTDWSPRPQLRIGIDTGEVLIDSAGQAASRTSHDVTGEAANVAARVEALAPLDGVTITERTRRLIGTLYQSVDRGLHKIRGVSEPIRLYDIVGRSESGVAEQSPFVGRSDELATLARRFDDRSSGRPILIEAGAGLGKTRLLAEFVSRTATDALIVRGLPSQIAVPFAPFSQAIDWEPPAGPRRQMFESLGTALQTVVGDGMLIVEDIQWMDASSIAAIEFFVGDRVLPTTFIAMTSRLGPGQTPDLDVEVDKLTLGPLDESAANELAAALTGGETTHLDQLVDRAEGVPLFVEQLARHLIEHPSPNASLPATIHELLAVQLDRAGDARRLAQIGSVFGRTFPCDELSELDDGLRDTAGALATLAARGLIDWAPPQPTATFRHALVRDVAYRSLLRSERRMLHAKVADRLESRSTAEAAELAQHRTDAEQPDSAAKWWLAAAQHALANHAFVEANRTARAALDALAELPPAIERDQRELMTLLVAASTVMVNEASTDQVESWFDRARALAAESGDENERLIALVGIASTLSQAGRHRDADDLGSEIIAAAEAAPSKLLRLMAYAQHGMTRFNVGAFHEAHELLSHAVELWQPDRHDSLATRVPLDPGVMATGDLCAIELLTDRHDHAHERIGRFVADSARWHDGHGRAIGLGLIARALVDVGDHAGARPFVNDSLELAIEHGALHTELQMRCLQATHDVRAGGIEQLDGMITAEADIRSGATMHSWTSLATASAEAANEVGAHQHATDLIDMVVAHGVLHGETYAIPKALLVRSAAHRSLGDVAASTNDAREALDWANRHGNTAFATRATDAIAVYD